MERQNHSQVTKFIFVGFMDHPELQIPLFVLFLCIYIVTMMGNFGMIILIQTETRLRTPMYFFLSNLSLVDLACYCTNCAKFIAPKMLLNFIAHDRSISFIKCAVQFCFVCFFVTNECCLLGVMAYDRFVAICNPLLYHTAMSKRLCLLLLILSYITGFVNSTAQTISIFSLSYCDSNVINHFFCDIAPILKLSCSDIHNTDIVHFTLSTIIVVSTILIVVFRSAEGRYKAFSTCASHLLYTMGADKFISVFYTLVIPMLNPLICSLRSKEVKEAMKRAINRKLFAERIN
uniref:G-protein coupled receptors family 1 profile domain-containing protein n=1 Tax=Salvator merianae TaxID=96440 RepID=A0A8D0BSI4_SALMN